MTPCRSRCHNVVRVAAITASLLVLLLLAGCGASGSGGTKGSHAGTKGGTSSVGPSAGFLPASPGQTRPAPSTTTPQRPRDQSTRAPLPGNLLIADRGNARLIVVTPDKRIVWQYHIPGGTGPLTGADDAFFSPDGRRIVFNVEYAHWIGMVEVATRRLVWRYGHPGTPGSAPGYLDRPDDAYLRSDGLISVADIRNERVLLIDPASKRVVGQYGTAGVRGHRPPQALTSPNGDTPLPGGGLLLTEIGGGWVDLLDARGHLLWALQLRDISYPSDAQLLPDGTVLVADYSTPGKVEIVRRDGTVLWRYGPVTGAGSLARPSLAIRLENGNIAVTDDAHHRVVVIDRHTKRIVWQYGSTGIAGEGLGRLHTPDGMDPVPAGSPLASARYSTP